ncbi:MAG: serine/threonine-protein kinase [Minicystis sp.]
MPPSDDSADPPLDSSREENARISLDLEESCDFSGAARAALLAGDARRAVTLAVLGTDEVLSERTVLAVAEQLSKEQALRAASDLAARGFGRHAGALYARLGAHLEAGQAFAAANDACRAAQSFERAGRPADGARALESALRVRPSDAACRYELGRLLARHGRTESAVKTLQLLDADTPERRRSLPLLRRCLIELGLEEAARTLREEMARLGVAEDAPEDEALERPASSPTLGGALLLGRYETLREVANTPHARVIEALDRLNGDKVAVKLLAGLDSEQGRDASLRFEREARALAQLRHPNVVPLRAYHPEGPAIVLAWMPGGSLVDRLRQSTEGMAPARAAEIVSAVLAALGEAHRLGILHRDVKPANVLFDDVGAARLSDFGAAHLGDLSSTATAGAIGTFAYMSPEQRLGRPASLASDLYGTGALLAELLTGEAAVPVTDRLAVLPSACHPDLTEAHDAIVARFLQEDPKKRPADAFEARRLLLSLPWPERIWKREKRRSIRPPSDHPGGPDRARLTATLDIADGRDLSFLHHDTWLDRDVLIHPLDEPTLTRARAFARAGHPTLPAVLRIDQEANEIWIAPPRGRSLADHSRGLSPGQVARLREALELLHAVEGAHGQVDAEHLYWHDGEITLAYPRSTMAVAEAMESDRAALLRLAVG